MEIPRLVDAEEIADVFGVPRQQVHQMIRDQQLPGIVKLGRRVRVREDKLREFIEAGGCGLPEKK